MTKWILWDDHSTFDIVRYICMSIIMHSLINFVMLHNDLGSKKSSWKKMRGCWQRWGIRSIHLIYQLYTYMLNFYFNSFIYFLIRFSFRCLPSILSFSYKSKRFLLPPLFFQWVLLWSISSLWSNFLGKDNK